MLALALTLLPAQAQVGAAQPGPQLTLPRISLRAGLHQLDVQVARRPQERQIGLMYRRELPEHEGMLFVFDAPAVQCFWMKNTWVP
ncbi:MAG: DUF192 domain-containing protein, partial [Ottowia sp.]|nr:DUF192 domain-containing protein [Ottowia sp.]